jgi:hypothetical protein
MILGKRGYGEIFQTLFHLVQKRLTLVWVFQGATEYAKANGDVLKGAVGLYGRVHNLAEMGWNPDPVIQIIVETPNTWKVVIGMNGD